MPPRPLAGERRVTHGHLPPVSRDEMQLSIFPLTSPISRERALCFPVMGRRGRHAHCQRDDRLGLVRFPNASEQRAALSAVGLGLQPPMPEMSSPGFETGADAIWERGVSISRLSMPFPVIPGNRLLRWEQVWGTPGWTRWERKRLAAGIRVRANKPSCKDIQSKHLIPAGCQRARTGDPIPSHRERKHAPLSTGCPFRAGRNTVCGCGEA